MKQQPKELNCAQHSPPRYGLSLRVLALLMLTVWAGCRQDPKTAAETNPAGTYALASVDGKTVPCAVQHEGANLTIKSGSFVINPDGTCSSRMVFTPPSGSDASREVKATYTREGTNLTMRWQGAGMTTGTIQGGAFTMNNEGMVLKYQKRAEP